MVPPAHLWVPPGVTSTDSARDCAELAGQLGFELDPEQQLALDALLAEKGDRWATLEAVLIAARQNLKTFLFKMIALYELFVVESRLVVWTAHEFDTAMEAFRDLQEIIDGTDWLRRRVKLVRNEVGTQGNTKVGIEFLTGQRIRFKARTKSGGRGLTGDVVFLDEAFALAPTHVGSLLPTMAAKSMHGNPRIYYGSSAGHLQSGVLRNLRDRGRAGTEDPAAGDDSLVYVEWCAPEEGACADEQCTHAVGVAGCAADDIEMVRQANPALERRISIEFVRTMRRSLPTDEFVREFLGWWEDPIEGESGIAEADWEACANRDPQLVLAEPCAVALDVQPGQGAGALVACGGPVHVVQAGPGTSWMIPKLVEVLNGHKVTAVGVDPASPAVALIPDLERPVDQGGAGLTVRSAQNPNGRLVLLDGRDAAKAREGLLAAIVEHTFVHRDELSLNAAASGAQRRKSGDTWRWSRVDSTVDITPLVAAGLARYLHFEVRFQKKPQVAGHVDQEAVDVALAQIREEERRALEALRSE